MGNLWSRWDDRVKSTGRPSRVAQDLTDAELLNLLASADPERGLERRILKEEAWHRLHRGPPAMPPPVPPRTSEPTPSAYGPEHASELP